jgi:chorismate mutase
MRAGRESNGVLIMALTERQERLAKEREEIAARVASFKATQEKFQREREEFFRRTWRNVGDVQPKKKTVWS